MRVAIWSHSASARAGGGVIYVWGIASALATDHQVEVLCRPTFDTESLIDVLPDFGAGRPTVRPAPCSGLGRRRGELCRAWQDRSYDLVIVQSTTVARLCLGRRALLLCEFPSSRQLTWGERLRLRRFHRVIANAQYTADWIERRWHRRATVLHPPVAPVARRTKQPIILGLGRFAAGGRSKRQLDLVELFRRLSETGAARGWSLHLAGFPADRRYVDSVRRAAEGLDVVLHLDLPRPRLEALIGEASIFWHAVGEGLDAEDEPERMEHFGIATVEAMSAGCVPVVIDRGGQREIVDGGDGAAGVLWQDFGSCLEITRSLIADRSRREELGVAAARRAEAFSFDRFAGRLRALVAELESVAPAEVGR